MLNFSSQTNSDEVQKSIEDKLEMKGKGIIGGKNNTKSFIFIDDINMPAYEEYGAQPPIELLR
jgi:dynein heavy chain